MKALIIGGTGLLGRYLIQNKPDGIDLMVTGTEDASGKIGVDFRYLNFDDSPEDRLHFMREEPTPEVVIYLAGLSSPDEVERNPEYSSRINISSAIEVFSEAIYLGAKFVYISSNGIYDGSNPPYAESSPQHPVNLYGAQKSYVERVIRDKAAIVRPSLMYGNLGAFTWARKNIVLQVLDKLHSGKTISCFNDIFCKPLYAGQCADAIWKIIQRVPMPGESWNIAGGTSMSIYGLAAATEAIWHDTFPFGPSELILSRPAHGLLRPKDTSFDTTKIETVLEMRPLPILEGLRAMKNEENNEDGVI
jgi:S-adenosylmethionine synthetase